MHRQAITFNLNDRRDLMGDEKPKSNREEEEDASS